MNESIFFKNEGQKALIDLSKINESTIWSNEMKENAKDLGFNNLLRI
jgi:hypothetical protein